MVKGSQNPQPQHITDGDMTTPAWRQEAIISMTLNANEPNKAFAIVTKVNKQNKPFICRCPNREPEKIKLNAHAHLRGCWIRKELTTGRFMVDTSVILDQFNYCYSLGVVLTH